MVIAKPLPKLGALCLIRQTPISRNDSREVNYEKVIM